VLAFFLGLLSLLIFVKPVLAGDPPTQISPANNSTVSSTALNWQAPTYTLYPTSPYRIQVDDDSSFSSLNKDYYTTNTHYTPTLSTGTWFWRVKAKDESGLWSNWSSIWLFILSESIPSPSPATTPTPSPADNPTPTPTPLSFFTITNTPSQINSDQQFNITVNLSLPSNPNTTFYLKGAFKKPDGSNYFGETLVSGSWVKNGSSFTNQYQITTDSSGNWSGTLEVRPDNSDSGFTGTGDYIFKVGRYTASGSGPTWSNESTIKIISAENQQEENITTTSSPATSPISSPSTKTETTSSVPAKSSGKLTYRIASVAAAATAASPLKKEDKIDIKSQKQTSPAFWTGLILIIAGAGSIGYIYLKKNGKIRI